MNIDPSEQDPHSKRLLKVCDLDRDIPEEAVRRARRAYYGAVSYVDDNVGKLLAILKDTKMVENTIVIFSADHGDMLGERNLWYKMSWFEGSARIPLIIHNPRSFGPSRISDNVSTLDILATLVDLAGGRVDDRLPLDGRSLVPQCKGQPGVNEVFGEYCGEGTVTPYMMIKRGSHKYITCPADPPQLFDLASDPHELRNLMLEVDTRPEIRALADQFQQEAERRWDFKAVHEQVLRQQRMRRLCWDALKQGRFEAWDYQPRERAQDMYVFNFPLFRFLPPISLHFASPHIIILHRYTLMRQFIRYIRSHMPLDELELRARYPPVDEWGREKKRGDARGVAAAYGQ